MSIEPITREEKIIAGEDIQPITRLEYFLKEYSGGGGGGGLPSYTPADEEKALTIKKADPVPVETIIIPEQRVTVPRGGTATLIDVIYPFPEFEEGQEATVTVTYEETASWTLVYREIDGTIGFFDEGKNNFLIYYNLAWQFDPGIDGIYTVSLKADIPSQPMVPKTIVPQMTLTLEDGGMAWMATFSADSGVDFDFFENAQAGDEATFILDGQEYVSTAASYYGMILFPLGEGYVVGYASLLGGTGLAALDEPEEKTHTISGTRPVPDVTAKWAEPKNGLYYFELGVTTPQDIIDAIDAGKLVVYGRPDTAGSGMGILTWQWYFDTSYRLVFLGATSNYMVRLFGESWVSHALTDPYESENTNY